MRDDVARSRHFAHALVHLFGRLRIATAVIPVLFLSVRNHFCAVAFVRPVPRLDVAFGDGVRIFFRLLARKKQREAEEENDSDRADYHDSLREIEVIEAGIH